MKTAIILFVAVICCAFLSGCQVVTRNFGGDTTIELEANTKLEMITWKDSDLWYLTRPMTDDDVAETHTFQQSSATGLLEGTVTIIESKE